MFEIQWHQLLQIKTFIFQTAMKCVGHSGFFLDLSAYDMTENSDIGMSFLEGDRSYKAVDFSTIFRPDNIKNRQVRLTVSLNF